MNDLLDNITAQLRHFTHEETVALVRDFLTGLDEKQHIRFLNLVAQGPRPLVAEAMGLDALPGKRTDLLVKTCEDNAGEARTMMKREVLQAWEDRAISAQSKIEESLEPELGRLRYELEIAQRLLTKAQDEAARETWQTQVDVLQMMIGMTESELTEQQEELSLCEAMIAEIEADLTADQPA